MTERRQSNLEYESKRIEEYDIIRVIATVLVVIGHAGYLSAETNFGGIAVPQVNISSGQSLVDLLIRLIYSFHMPLFFALSGAVFCFSLLKRKYNTFGALLRNKTKRLIIPYMIASLLYVIPIKYFVGYYADSKHVLNDIVFGQLFLCGNTHLWYLVVLFELTMLAWFVERIQNDVVKILLIAGLFLIGGSTNIQFMGISRVCTNFTWFYLGMWYEKRRTIIKDTVLKKKTCFLGIGIVYYILVMLLYLKFMKGNEYFYGLVNFGGIFISFIIACFLSYTHIIDNTAFKRILKYSFSIYILSDPLNYLLLWIIAKWDLFSILSSFQGCILFFVVRILLTITVPLLIVTTKTRIQHHLSYI